MKTNDIARAMRNATTPAARLAAWQRIHPARRLAEIRRRLARPAESLAAARREAIAARGPELSAPEAAAPLLWEAMDSPEIREAIPGRRFLDHMGWYTDEYQEETVETYAVRLVRFPHLMFYAVRDSCHGDLCVHLGSHEEIDFSEHHHHPEDAIEAAARDIVRSYDDATARSAEESREYYRKERVAQDMEENRDALKTLRQSIRDLCRELKTLCPLASQYPAAASALRASIASMLQQRRDLFAENEKLAATI